jgi:hypothetical protein
MESAFFEPYYSSYQSAYGWTTIRGLIYNIGTMNKVFVNDSVVEIKVVGNQNAASIDLMGRDLRGKLITLRAQNKPCLVLDDLREIGTVDAAGRKLVVELAKRLDYDRLAMLGKPGVIKLGANLMLRAVGRAGSIRYFDNEDEAIAWLKEKV